MGEERRFSVAIDGHRVAVLAAPAGRPGPPLVLLHGITLSNAFWPPVLPPETRERANWISLSLPGHAPGRWPETPTPVTADLFADVLAGVLDALHVDEPAALLGYSTGGFAALALAAAHPERVRAVCSVCGFADGRWAGLMGILQRLARGGPAGHLLFRVALHTSLRTSVGRYVFALFASDRTALARSVLAEHVASALTPDLRRHDLDVLRQLFAGLRTVDITDRLPAITAPVLLVAGADDPIIPLHRQQRMAATIPTSKLAILDGCGHLFYAERTAKSHALLAGWWEEVRRNSPAAPAVHPASTLRL